MSPLDCLAHSSTPELSRVGCGRSASAKVEVFFFGLRDKKNWGTCQVHFLTTALPKEGTTLTYGEIEAGEDGKHKQAPSQLFSAHFRSTLGGDLGSKASPQISHWTKFEGHSLTARARAEPTHALAELVLIMTLLSRVHFPHFPERLNDFPRVTQLGNMECK